MISNKGGLLVLICSKDSRTENNRKRYQSRHRQGKCLTRLPCGEPKSIIAIRYLAANLVACYFLRSSSRKYKRVTAECRNIQRNLDGWCRYISDQCRLSQYYGFGRSLQSRDANTAALARDYIMMSFASCYDKDHLRVCNT